MSVVLVALLYETTTAFEDTRIECLSALYVTAWRSKTIAVEQNRSWSCVSGMRSAASSLRQMAH